MSKRQFKRQTFKGRFVTAIRASSLLDSPRAKSVPFGAITGIFFLIGGLVWLSQSFFLAAHGIPAKGTVSNLSTSRSSENFDITFLTAHGQRITTSTFTPIGSETYQDGNIVRILYNPTDPKKIVVDSSSALWFDAWATTLFGAFLTLVFTPATYVLIRRNLRQRHFFRQEHMRQGSAHLELEPCVHKRKIRKRPVRSKLTRSVK